MTLHLEIVTQEKLVFEDEAVDMVLVPALEGIMGVLPRHAPVLTTLGYGELVIRKGNAEERFAIYGGLVDVRPGKVTVLAELAESSFALDLAEAEDARARAQKLITEGIPSDDNRDATLALRRADLNLRISRKLQQRTPVMRIIQDDDTDQ